MRKIIQMQFKCIQYQNGEKNVFSVGGFSLNVQTLVKLQVEVYITQMRTYKHCR